MNNYRHLLKTTAAQNLKATLIPLHRTFDFLIQCLILYIFFPNILLENFKVFSKAGQMMYPSSFTCLVTHLFSLIFLSRHQCTRLAF